ncbi:hypothetical protein [Streptomyces sp. NPDC002467]|uniref:DUF7739 domain-containing protein n=1 Tax=Streptomyces sp. NPDC002467 TaxID=3364647 RepID=UPI0036C85C91
MKGSFAMGYSISHGGTRYGYSATSLSRLGDKLRKSRNTDWPTLEPILGSRPGDPFDIHPQQAQRIGQALHQAAGSLKIWDRNWAAMARQIADSALLAARLGEPWRWS